MFDTHAPTHRILIVDDEFVPRNLESIALESTGRYYTVEAGNGADAITALSGETCDCAIIDLAMPDMTGLELVRLIRQNRANRDLPIVLVLPEGLEPGEAPKHYPGVTKVIAKPFDPWDLSRLVDMLVGTMDNSENVLSIEAVLRGFPYPTMILDAYHHVVLANGAFYEATETGVGACYVYCNQEMHEDGQVAQGCPLDECATTGKPAERMIGTVMGDMRVSVYPLATKVGNGDRLFLHVTQPWVAPPA